MLLKLQLSNYQSSSTTNIIIKYITNKSQIYFSPSGKEQLHYTSQSSSTTKIPKKDLKNIPHLQEKNNYTPCVFGIEDFTSSFLFSVEVKCFLP